MLQIQGIELDSKDMRKASFREKNLFEKKKMELNDMFDIINPIHSDNTDNLCNFWSKY